MSRFSLVLLFQIFVFNHAFGQQADTIRIQGYHLLLADTLIAKYVRVDDLDENVSGYPLKQIAVVFEREQFLRKYGLASETLLLHHYPITEWRLIPYYRKNNGSIEEAIAFDSRLIDKAWLKKRHKKAGGSALLVTGLLGIAYGFMPLPEPQNIGQGIGQGIGRRFFPIVGTVSLVSGLIILGS